MKNEPTSFGYLSYPSAEKAPAIIVIHEIWGLNDQIRSVADRFAAEGYLALAPDLMKGEGLGFVDPALLQEMADPAKRDEAQKKMRTALAPTQTPEFGVRTISKLRACFDFLKSHPSGNGTVGVVGFCFGGTYAFALAGADGVASELRFAIAFYGHPPTEAVIKEIKCPILAFYGVKDEGLIKTVPELEAMMEKYDKNFRAIVYPDAGHAFFNDQNPLRYNAEAAAKAWEEVKKFLAGL